MRGEKIYEYDADVTGLTDYGVSLQAILSGKEKVPPQGLRVDITFEGKAAGRLAGRVRGVDYVRMRADGRMDLDIRAVIETDNGSRIAISTDGVVVPHSGAPTGDVAENVSLYTAAKDYVWVNNRQVWGVGTVNFATGKVHVDAYMQ